MAVSFHQLHIFYTVATKGSFSAAAQSLHMTQPAVTMQVQALEEYFGTRLFHRSTKKVELSEAGKALLPYAQKSIELMRETDQAMSRYTHMLRGKLQLGASLTIGEYILPRLLGPFSQAYPHITISLKVMNTTQIEEEIVSHQLNFGLVEAPVRHPDIRSETIWRDELMLILPADHPLNALPVITVEDAFRHPFVLRERGSGTRKVMEEQFNRAGIDPGRMNIVMELGSTGAVKSAVESGLGITILSHASVKHETKLGVLTARRIEGVRFTRDFFAVYLDSALLPMPAMTLLTFLRENDLSNWLL